MIEVNQEEYLICKLSFESSVHGLDQVPIISCYIKLASDKTDVLLLMKKKKEESIMVFVCFTLIIYVFMHMNYSFA